MVNIKNIKNKIINFSNIKKITKAMEMISVIKIKRLELKKKKILPYILILKKILKNLVFLSKIKKEKNIFLFRNNVKKVVIIIILTSKGLCNGLNNNLFKFLLPYLKNFLLKNISYELIIFGKKEINFLNKFKKQIKIYDFNFFKSSYSINLFKILNSLFKNYKLKSFDQVFIVFHKFYNKINYKLVFKRLLPIKINFKQKNEYKSWDYIYESSRIKLFENVFNKFFKSMVYNNILENLISEYSSRIISMRNSSENSSNLIKELNIIYNKARQYNITQELTEIISGSSVI
ncbi:ATP synthase F1 subunit gamma [Buchnera aphidicola (Periphyllus koelreuteriae)]|uniref:ATP synthase F1 subunit gamma n=1 Tax=Buchnera aphidicola TaxID=9 RepID=UPI0031B80162